MDTAYNGVLTDPGAPPPCLAATTTLTVAAGVTSAYRQESRLPLRQFLYIYQVRDPSETRGDLRSTSRDRDHSSRSRPRSRASSLSLEEMLNEATTTPAEERPGPDGHMQQRGVHPSQHLHPSARHRAPSPRRDAEYHLAVPEQHSRSRAHSSVQLHPSAHASGPIASPPGPRAVPGQVPTYQTHVFAPPVTGAPVKKSKLGAASSTLSANGSVLTLGPSGSVISGPSTIGGGGVPPTNAQGRYKEGKCTTRPLRYTPPGAPQAALGGLANGRSIHGSDTMHVHPSSHSQGRALGSSGTHILSSSGSSSQSSDVCHDRDRERERDRDRDYDRPATPHSHYSSTSCERPSHGHAHKSSITSINGHRSGEGNASSRSASHSPVMPAKTAAAGPSASARGSPRESDGKSKSSELMDVDADGEEVDVDVEADVDADAEADADADAEADAEAHADAELLEAVDAAEANNATDEEWLKKEDA
ncbi:hypothetical protein OH77DRAFT_1515152 [Trametes cingulata]|nr:hypothetical protein OH77DRAFT_1515152 [Trametes cingulata]